MNFTTLPLLATAAALALPAAASADTLVAPAPGAQHLTSGGGYLAWSAPAADGTGFQLTVRAPDGTVSTPDIPRFETAPDPSIGSGGDRGPNRPLVVVYARDGDIYRYDLRTGDEAKVPGASSAAYRESSPGIQYGRLSFVRDGGRNNGVFVAGSDRVVKVSSARPAELAFNGSRVAYPVGRKVVIRKVSGRGRPSTVRLDGRATSLTLSRYSLTFVTRGGHVLQTPRFGGSSGIQRVATAREANERLPETLNSVAPQGSFIRFYADAEGVKRISTQNLFR
jgi:hypothetical protein